MAEPQDMATDSADTEDPYANMRSSKPWLEDIKEAERCLQKWQEKCDNIDKQYADLEKFANDNRQREMQIFWANLEVLKPSIYARPPVPVVTSRFKDRKPLNRHASEILERCLITSFDNEDIHETMKLARDDLARNGRGVTWLRYETDEQNATEKNCYDHLDRKDFAHGPARKWKEVPWVARRSYLNRERMRARFESASGDAWMKADYREREDGDDKEYVEGKTAAVWELWSKEKGVVVWVTEGVEDVLDIREPFLTLDRFFPCPKPAYGTVKPGTLVPVPDFLYYKDQIEEINELTARISALSESLKMKGFYSAGNEDVAGAVESAMKATDNNAILIPVPNVSALGGAGMKDAIVWMPVKEVADVITALVALRRQVIEDVYQITGISDIMRGQTDPNETKGAQVIKSQYGSVRVKERQEEMVRIARDMTRISGEIMAENFQPQTLIAMSQYEECPSQQQVQQQIMQVQQGIASAARDPNMVQQAQQNPQMAQQAIQQAQAQIKKLQSQVTLEQVFAFLKDQRMRPFTLDIETDSTIQPDEDAAKQRTTEFMTALGGTLSQLAPMVQAQPESAGFAGEVLKFAVAPFRAGRSLDSAIDDFVEQAKKAAGQPKPDPQAEQAKQEMQQSKQKHEQDMQLNAQKGELDITQKKLDIAESQAKVEKAIMDGMIEEDGEGNGTTRGPVKSLIEQLTEIRQLFGQMIANGQAPKEVMRGNDGAITGYRAGGQTFKVVRGPDGQIQQAVPVQ